MRGALSYRVISVVLRKIPSRNRKVAAVVLRECWRYRERDSDIFVKAR